MLTTIGNISTWVIANANWLGLILFAATAIALILMGTTPMKRAGGCLVQACIVIAVLKANLPGEKPTTDVGRFSAAVHQRLEDRLAERIEVQLAANAR